MGNTEVAFLKHAAMIIIENNIASTSLLQRRMRLGYNNAARIMDKLSELGIIGVRNGIKPREILIKDKSQIEEIIKLYR